MQELHPPTISDGEIETWAEQGYVRLGHVAPTEEIEALCERIDAIMLGQVTYDKMYMQLCPSAGDPEKAKHTRENKGSSLKYRKIQDLEWDPLFRAYIQKPLFRDITKRIIGEDVCVFRAMFMNKPAGQGVLLNWHQDGTGGWGLSIAPKVTIWTALDDTSPANGCLRLVPGSHKSIIIPGQDFLGEEEIAIHAPPEKQIHMEMERGEVVLLHNWTLHSSEPNQTNRPRRGFSTCYIDAATESHKTGDSYSKIFPEYEPAPITG